MPAGTSSSGRGWGVPEECEEIARIPRDQGIGDRPLGERLMAMAGMGNILARMCRGIDDRKLYEVVTAQLSDFDEYARALLDYVAEDLREEGSEVR